MVIYKYVRTDCIHGAITYREIRDVLPRRRGVCEGHTFKKTPPHTKKYACQGIEMTVLGLSAGVHVCLELVVQMRRVRQQCLSRDDSMSKLVVYMTMSRIRVCVQNSMVWVSV